MSLPRLAAATGQRTPQRRRHWRPERAYPRAGARARSAGRARGSPVTLSGHGVRLEPLSEPLLLEATRVALSSPAIWTYIPYPMRDATEVGRALALGLAMMARSEALPLVTRLEHTGQIVGGTSLRLVDRTLASVEIGGTWLVPDWQRTHVNTAAKLRQLGHCFERPRGAEDGHRQRALARGHRQAGRQRGGHSASAPAPRRRPPQRQVLFSLLPREWPAVRERLGTRLTRRAGAPVES